MYSILISLGFLAAIGIAWQDFRFRQIHILLLIALGLAGLALPTHYVAERLQETLINFGLICFIFLFLFLILRFSHQGKIMDRMLGWGDVVMLFSLACWFGTFDFLCFYTFSTVLLSLGFGFALSLKKIKRNFPIPLAGAWAICFVLFYSWLEFI